MQKVYKLPILDSMKIEGKDTKLELDYENHPEKNRTNKPPPE